MKYLKNLILLLLGVSFSLPLLLSFLGEYDIDRTTNLIIGSSSVVLALIYMYLEKKEKK